MMENSSLTIPVPNVITSSPSGGRFEFDDGGSYCGGWQDGKAHGYGICTGPKNVGEYSGSWNFGFEMSGVYLWKNGAVYEGRWQNGKRHGVGVEFNGKWHYRGEWSQGFKGRYGVKSSTNSAVKYEGTWANGLQDGYGSETYSDGGYYQGQMCRGLRHGYGVRKSAPYGDSQLNNPNKNGQLTGISTASMLIHSNSLQSAGSIDIDDDSPKPEDGFKPNIDRTLASKNGFVLVAKPLDVPMPSSSSSSKYNGDSGGGGSGGGKSSGGHRRNSLTNKIASARIPGSNQTASLLRGLRLRKQKSTSDLDNISGRNTPGGRSGGGGGVGHGDGDFPIVPFSLSPEELDITDPTTVETYTGEWKHDKRNGHGVCDRSDGLKYEGQWHNDMKCGYGVTTFKNGTKEEGKYKNNILIVDSKVKKFFQLGSGGMRQKIDDAVKMAQQAQTMALKKAEIADTRAATARDKADQAATAAFEAQRDSKIAFSVARQYSDSQQQQQLQQFGGMANSNDMIQGNLLLSDQIEPMLPNLGMTSSSLQMRRISQQQQQLNRYSGIGGGGQLNNNMGAMMQDGGLNINMPLQQQQLQQQYLGPGPIEPFNGRRGSFRGGSQPSSGYQSGFAIRHNMGNNPIGGYGGTSSGGGAPSSGGTSFGQSTGVMNRQSSTDPFNDLFDHYKSTGSSANFPGVSNAARRMPMKQASLDYNQLNNNNNPQRFNMSASNSTTGYGGGESHVAGGPMQVDSSAMSTSSLSRLRHRFRMSSMDHAEENNHNKQQSQSQSHHLDHPMSSMNSEQQSLINRDNSQLDSTTTDNNNNNMQQQFKQLVTSGEDLQQQQQQQQVDHHSGANSQPMSNSSSNLGAADIQTQSAQGITPAGSSYILPQSTNSSYFGNQTTPSPDGQSSFRSPSGQQYYAQQQQQQQQHQQQIGGNYPARAFQPTSQYAHHHMKQRDVHSLADEQLYMAGRRIQDSSPLDRSEYSNYDFAISSAPRLSQRCMPRTASLSRKTPVRSSDLRTLSGGGSSTGSTFAMSGRGGGQLGQRQRSASPAISVGASPPIGRTTTTLLNDPFQASITVTAPPAGNSLGLASGGGGQPQQGGDITYQANHIGHPHEAPSNLSSHLTIDSSTNSSASLIRKSSLQNRYDPVELGGLMSRKEVYDLSHAQREQKRIEAEMAEKRAKQPILHLYLNVKEFITRQRLLLSVLIINVFLFKMFADLIV